MAMVAAPYPPERAETTQKLGKTQSEKVDFETSEFRYEQRIQNVTILVSVPSMQGITSAWLVKPVFFSFSGVGSHSPLETWKPG